MCCERTKVAFSPRPIPFQMNKIYLKQICVVNCTTIEVIQHCSPGYALTHLANGMKLAHAAMGREVYAYTVHEVHSSYPAIMYDHDDIPDTQPILLAAMCQYGHHYRR